MSLRRKIMLLGLVAIAGMCLALWLQYMSYVGQSRSIEAVARNVKTVGSLSHATHQLQKERGLTTINLAKANSQAITEQIRQTDAALARLAATGVHIDGLDNTLLQLRAAARTRGAEQLAIRDDYTKLLQGLIDEMNQMISAPGMNIAKANISAHTHLVAAKEYLGQTRASLGYAIDLKHAEDQVMRSLIRLKSLYDEELRKFELEASPALHEIFGTQFAGLEVAKTMDIMAQIAATGKLPPALDVQTWWSMATTAIDRLNLIEDHSLKMIEQHAESELAQLQRGMHLRALTTLAICFAVLVLAVSATVTLLRALERALTSMEIIASSQDFRSRIPADSPDEIGRMSRSFNQLLDIAERLLKDKDFLATTDSLTGINNRWRFSKVFGEEAEMKRRSKAPMALVLFDVDHFKHINDTAGHLVGDEVLKALTSLVKREIRATEFFARWGGEEFVLLLRDDGCEAAIAVAEKLRNLIASQDFPGVGKVTCSFGVTAWQQDDSETSLVARADKALFEAKKGGRNQVKHA
ncbi:MAG: diguanylate cyclase [Betaproteobacteria bacterium]|nr:diguanylate cyclase [Betaproteobacteria bacterium]